MSAEQDLLNSISLIVDQAIKSTTKIYTGIVDSVDTIKKTCDVVFNKKIYTVAYYGGTPSVNSVCRIFSPENNFSNAFIIVGGEGGGGGGTTNYNELSNLPKINNTTLKGNKTATDLGLLGADVIPTPTSEDENKVLGVKNGAYELIDMPTLKGSFATTTMLNTGMTSSGNTTIVNHPNALINCVETAGGTSLTANLNVRAGQWVLATVSTRSDTTFSSGWNLLHSGTIFSDLTQRMYFLSKYVETDSTISLTVNQTTSARIYINLIAMSNINGFIYHNGSEFVSQEEINEITLDRPNYDKIIWGCSANLWSTSSTRTTWSCDNLVGIDIPNTTQPRQCNFIDVDIDKTTRIFKAGTENTCMAIDYVEVI